MYTPISIDVFCSAYAGAMGAYQKGRSPHSTITSQYARVSEAALAFASAFDAEFAVILPDVLQLQEIETLASQILAYPNNATTALSPSTYGAVCDAIIAMMNEASSVVAMNVPTPIPTPAPPTGIPVIQIPTVAGIAPSLKSTVPATAIAVIVDGYATAGDGGGGEFYWDPTSVAADNVGTIVNPTGHVLPGRWIRILRQGGTLVNVRWFGAKGDFELHANGQDATATSPLVPWRAFAVVDGATYIGKVIAIEGAGVAGADYWGVITAYNTVTHNWTVAPAPATTVVNAANLYATDDTAAFLAARTYANVGTNAFYPAGYDLRTSQVYAAHGSFFIPEGLTGDPCGFKLDNATIWGDYKGNSLWDIISPGQEFSGPRLFTSGVYRGFRSVIKYWSDTFNGLQCNVWFDHAKFQDCRYAVMNTRNGNFFLTFDCCEFENSGIAKGFFAALNIVEPQGTSFGSLGTIFTAAVVQGVFTDGSILVGGTEDGQICPNGAGSIINILGGNLSPLVNAMTGAIDGQAWIIARRLTILSINGVRLGGELAGLPLLRLEEEAIPATEGSADGSAISIINGSVCVSSNLPNVVFDDAAPLGFLVSEDSQLGNFGGIGKPIQLTQTAYDKLYKRTTNWAQVALNKVGSVGNINQAVIAHPSYGSYPSSSLLTLSRVFRPLETREYPNVNLDVSGNVYDAVIAVSNVTIADTTIQGFAGKKITSTNGVDDALVTLRKYFPDLLIAGHYTVTVPYICKGSGLTTIQASAWSMDGPSVNFAALEDTGGAIKSFSFDFYYDGSATANSHIIEYNIDIPAADPTHYFILGRASLTFGKYGGQLIPIGGAPIPPFFLSGSATWDPGNLIPTASATKNVTVTGAKLGGYVVGKSFGLDLQGLTLTADVTAPDTVTAVLANNTAGIINLAVGTIAVDVYQPAEPFDPGILQNMVFRVRADQGITLNAGNVSQWNDLSPSGFNLLQATAGLQPLFVAAARNSRPCVRGDGVDDLLFSAIGANPIGSGAYTVFAVTQGNGAAAKYFFQNGHDNPGSLASGFVLGNSGAGFRSVGHAGVIDHDDAAPTANAELWTANRAAGASPTLRVNGANQALSNAGTPGLIDPGGTARIALFGSVFPVAWFPGDIYELIVYNRALTVSEVVQVENYLNRWYAIY